MKTVRTIDFADQTKPGSGHYNGAPTIGDGDDEASSDDLIASRAQFWKLASSSDGFPAKPVSGTDTSRDYFAPGRDPGNNGKLMTDDDYNANGEMVMGTFDGVPGAFECRNTTGCTVRHSATNGLSSHQQDMATTVAEWQFIATSSASNVATARPDGDYLTIGFWRQSPDFSTGTHRFATFATGRDPFAGGQAAITALEGEAEYEGPAYGLYSANFRVGDQFPDLEGFFSATAKLTADFGGDPDDDAQADTIPGTISGTVSGFSGDHPWVEDWNVVLGEAPLAGLADDDPVFNGSTVAENSRANGRHFDDRRLVGPVLRQQRRFRQSGIGRRPVRPPGGAPRMLPRVTPP